MQDFFTFVIPALIIISNDKMLFICHVSDSLNDTTTRTLHSAHNFAKSIKLRHFICFLVILEFHYITLNIYRTSKIIKIR